MLFSTATCEADWRASSTRAGEISHWTRADETKPRLTSTSLDARALDEFSDAEVEVGEAWSRRRGERTVEGSRAKVNVGTCCRAGVGWATRVGAFPCSKGTESATYFPVPLHLAKENARAGFDLEEPWTGTACRFVSTGAERVLLTGAFFAAVFFL